MLSVSDELFEGEKAQPADVLHWSGYFSLKLLLIWVAQKGPSILSSEEHDNIERASWELFSLWHPQR